MFIKASLYKMLYMDCCAAIGNRIYDIFHKGMLKQPAISCLGKTAEKSFPLMLFFGREYNNVGEVEISLGNYSFEESPKSAFWNRTYTFISRNCLLAPNFKNTCIAEEASPVLFSNVLPKPLLTSRTSADKRRSRISISKEKIDEYIDGIFSQPIICRVNLVVLSGVDDEYVFGHATSRIRFACERRNIVVEELPYFGSRSNNAILNKALSETGQKHICQTIKAFYGDYLGQEI